jgi:hypothetical protein
MTEQSSADPCPDVLRSMFGPVSPEKRAYRVRIRNARRDASVCAGCERVIGPEDEVYRQRFYMGRCLIGYSTRLAPVCSSCCVDKDLYTKGRACVGCGRLVHNLRDLIYRKHRFCSESCQAKAVAAVARDRRRQKRGLTRCCDQCGESYEPSRADALFCSGACRQKAYRTRSLRITSAPVRWRVNTHNADGGAV